MFILDQDTLDSVSEGFHIPPKPEALTKIQEIATLFDKDLQLLTEVVLADVELSGLVLKTINSPFFYLPNKVSDIRQSTITLGFENVYNVTMACVLKNAFSGVSCISLARFWDEAIEKAQLCQNICKSINNPVSDMDMYALGLFHDCGIAAMSIRFEDYINVLIKANNQINLDLGRLEQTTYGINHAAIGYTIAKSWHVPEDICQVILNHHNTKVIHMFSDEIPKLMAAILIMANNIYEQHRDHRNLPIWLEHKTLILDLLNIDDDKYQMIFNNYVSVE